MATYPTRGVELVVQPIANALILGWTYGVNFSRRNHDYTVRFYASGLAIERDGKKVTRWNDLPDSIQDIIIRQKHAVAAYPSASGLGS